LVVIHGDLLAVSEKISDIRKLAEKPRLIKAGPSG
ncbi:MAG: hypothetical protein RL272_399, partial [Candidatus Parcubacteria bacterium]